MLYALEAEMGTGAVPAVKTGPSLVRAFSEKASQSEFCGIIFPTSFWQKLTAVWNEVGGRVVGAGNHKTKMFLV